MDAAYNFGDRLGLWNDDDIMVAFRRCDVGNNQFEIIARVSRRLANNEYRDTATIRERNITFEGRPLAFNRTEDQVNAIFNNILERNVDVDDILGTIEIL